MTDAQNSPEILNAVAITIDVTGTLIHCPDLAEVYSSVLERHGTLIPASRLETLIPTVWDEMECRVERGQDRFGEHEEGGPGWWNDYLRRICEYQELEHPGPFAAAELFDRFAHADVWEIYPDVLPALDRMAAMGLRLAVLSNWDRRLPLLLDRLGLSGRFEAIIFSGEVGFEQPNPAIFNAALEALGLRPSSVVHIGDRVIDDVEGAAAAGIRALLLDRADNEGDVADLVAAAERLRRVEPMLS
jgi:putative hydrolase of the HAD superfamily